MGEGQCVEKNLQCWGPSRNGKILPAMGTMKHFKGGGTEKHWDSQHRRKGAEGICSVESVLGQG